jgi:hypothetical protein
MAIASYFFIGWFAAGLREGRDFYTGIGLLHVDGFDASDWLWLLGLALTITQIEVSAAASRVAWDRRGKSELFAPLLRFFLRLLMYLAVVSISREVKAWWGGPLLVVMMLAVDLTLHISERTNWKKITERSLK